MIKSAMTDKLSPRIQKQLVALIPLKRLGMTNEVAQTAIFLAQNDYVTGQTIVVDGGMTI
jgi:3-oxoacyl-[acyl-carrier protein] reductase